MEKETQILIGKILDNLNLALSLEEVKYKDDAIRLAITDVSDFMKKEDEN